MQAFVPLLVHFYPCEKCLVGLERSKEFWKVSDHYEYEYIMNILALASWFFMKRGEYCAQRFYLLFKSEMLIVPILSVKVTQALAFLVLKSTKSRALFVDEPFEGEHVSIMAQAALTH